MNMQPETWIKYYQLRYADDSRNIKELPAEEEFKNMLQDFERWFGKDFLKKRERNTENTLIKYLINLVPWSSYTVLNLYYELKYLKENFPSEFKKLIGKFHNDKFSKEAVEMIWEIRSFKAFGIKNIIVDPDTILKRKADIILDLEHYGKITIEISRLEDSHEEREVDLVTYNLGRFVEIKGGHYNYTYKLKQRMDFEIFKTEYANLVKAYNERKSEILVYDSEFMTLIIPFKNIDSEEYKNLCNQVGVEYLQRSGWTMNDKTYERSIEKIRKKIKQLPKDEFTIVSLHNISRLSYFSEETELKEIFESICENSNIVIRFNEFQLFKNTSFPKSWGNFILTEFPITRNYEHYSLFYIPEQYKSFRKLFL